MEGGEGVDVDGHLLVEVVLLRALVALRDAVALVQPAPVLHPPEQPPQPAADAAEQMTKRRKAAAAPAMEVRNQKSPATTAGILRIRSPSLPNRNAAETYHGGCAAKGGGRCGNGVGGGRGRVRRFSRGKGRGTNGYVGWANGVATRVVRRERTKLGSSFLFVDSKINPLN